MNDAHAALAELFVQKVLAQLTRLGVIVGKVRRLLGPGNSGPIGAA
jgi:hypothetical protein